MPLTRGQRSKIRMNNTILERKIAQVQEEIDTLLRDNPTHVLSEDQKRADRIGTQVMARNYLIYRFKEQLETNKRFLKGELKPEDFINRQGVATHKFEQKEDTGDKTCEEEPTAQDVSNA